ncbi:MAG: homoserine dehydrogenase [Deltaproteobacteria bacterium]|jgi:homoserine dehydrogenase|nr:homoserine dehydrogenase [Deltaproteobacteria bacterium]
MITNIGLLGLGTVGSGVAKILLEDRTLLTQKLGWPLHLSKVLVRNVGAERNFTPPAGTLTTDPYQIVGQKGIDIVCELMGGIEPARTFILEALEAGQHVVTANKALLAVHGQEIFEAASKANRDVMFEAAVAGAIPVIRTLKESLSANRIQTLFGILNGTTNHILSRMTADGLSYSDALKEAQAAGYAEADPTADVMGYDSAHKLIVLTALAYGVMPDLKDVFVEGITDLQPIDFAFADEFGYVIKLLALSTLCNGNDGRLEVRLHPVMIPKNHLLAGVSGAMNAVMIRGHACGDIFLSGAGAGMMPTASSVVGDIIELARTKHSLTSPRPPLLGWQSLKGESIKPITEVNVSYYLRFTVLDRPGVLSSISGAFGRHNISLAQLIQKGQRKDNDWVTLVMLTHTAQEGDLRKAIAETEAMDVVQEAKFIRIEDFL